MKVSLERLPESRVQVHVEVDQDRLERSVDAAYRRIAQRSRIPGFRPGKAPRSVVERLYGREGLIREAIDKLVPEAYNEAIEAEDVDAIGQPEDWDILSLDPLAFKAVVPVRPSVDLGDYTSVRIEPETVEVTDEMVAEQMLLLRRRYATQAPVDRPVKWDDVLIADIVGSADGEQFVEDTDAEFPLREGRMLFLPGLAEAFVGMSKGEEKTVDLEIPEDFQLERLQGKTASMTLSVKEVKEELLPEEDDEFAAQVNAEEFPTFEALRDRLKGDMLQSLQTEADEKFRAQVLDAMAEKATVEFPRVMVDREIDHMMEDVRRGSSQQAYAAALQSVGMDETGFRETFRQAAEKRVLRSLVLSSIADAEGLTVSAEDIEEEIAKLTAPMGDDAARFRELFASEDGVGTIRRNLLTTATMERIAAIGRGEASGEAPVEAPEKKSAAAVADGASSEEKPAKPRASRAKSQKAATAKEEPEA